MVPDFTIFTHGTSNSKEGQKWLERNGARYLFDTWGVICLHSDRQRIRVHQAINLDGELFRRHWVGNC